ncbi:MAG: Dabb family protein [Bacteroidia bacterium]|nr:Dabb family protein [Bacteroidia bacterium]
MRILFLFLAFFTLGITARAQQNSDNKSLLRHVVIFKFKDSSAPEDVKKVAEAFANLYGKVPQIKSFEWGINNSPEKFNEGFTHCFVLTFSAEKDLADYQLNPAHIEFQKILKPHMEKVFVVDYWVK